MKKQAYPDPIGWSLVASSVVGSAARVANGHQGLEFPRTMDKDFAPS